jgi:hypothetical protein
VLLVSVCNEMRNDDLHNSENSFTIVN